MAVQRLFLGFMGGGAIQTPAIPVHIFLLFSRTMAFFTIFAEGVFIFSLARVMSGWGASKREGASDYIAPAIFLFLLFILLFAGEWLCHLAIDLNRGYRLLIYRVVVWDFMATLYALLEGLICILAARLYLTLERQRRLGWLIPGGCGRPMRALPEVWLVVAVFLAMFALFEYVAVNTALHNHLRPQGILNMARFYRIVTGWFWTTFEAAVAVILIKIYLLMKPERPLSHGSA